MFVLEGARWRTPGEIFRVPSRCTGGRDDRAQWTRAEPARVILPLRRQKPSSSSKPSLILRDRAARPVRARLPALLRHVPLPLGKDLFSLSPTGEEVFSSGFRGRSVALVRGAGRYGWNPHAAAPRGGVTSYGSRVRKTAGISLSYDRPFDGHTGVHPPRPPRGRAEGRQLRSECRSGMPCCGRKSNASPVLRCPPLALLTQSSHTKRLERRTISTDSIE